MASARYRAGVIEIQDLHKSFRSASVLRGVTFSAPDGQVTGFVGPNGSGKSTTFRILAGIMAADSGVALLDGHAAADGLRLGKRQLGMFFGGATIPRSLTGGSYLRYVADLAGVSGFDAASALAAVGLAGAGAKKVGAYSMGMKQRLGIAAAFIGEPRNVVLDEPLNGLDVDGVRWLRQYVRAVADRGTCVVLSSHVLSELELVADSIVLLTEGRANSNRALHEMLRDAAAPIAIDCDDPAALASLLTQQGAEVTVETTRSVRVRGQTVNWIARVVGGSDLVVHSIAPVRRSIEQVYLEEVHRASSR